MTPAAAEQTNTGLSVDHGHRGRVGGLDDDFGRRDRCSSCRCRRANRWAPGCPGRGDAGRRGRCGVNGRQGGGRRRADTAALTQLGETGELLFVEVTHWQFHTPLSSSCGILQPGGIGGIGLLAGQSLGIRAPCGTPAIAGAAVVTVGAGGCVVGAAVGAGAGGWVVGAAVGAGAAVGDGAAVAAGVGAPAVVAGAGGVVDAGDSDRGASGAAPALVCGGAVAMAPGAGVSAGAVGPAEAAVAVTAAAAAAPRSAAPAMVSAVVSEWTTM